MSFVAGPAPIVEDLSQGELQRLMDLLWGRFQAIEDESSGSLFIDELHEEPSPIEGMTSYADGTDWDPGSGRGLYRRDASAWVKI